MNNANKCYLLATCFLLLLTACKKEGDLNVKPIKAFKPYTMNGFTQEPLEQFFDGVKVREIHGMAIVGGNVTQELAFDKDEIVMELKRKSNGETVYQQTFHINDATNEVPKFYFDGTAMLPRYNYPAPVGAAYTANFYFDFPKEAGAVDIVVEMVEYYFDPNLPAGYGIVGTTAIPIITNIQPGKWSNYITLNPLPAFPPKSRPDSEFLPYICVKKAGSALYFSNNENTDVLSKVELNSFPLQLPESWTTAGLVQSYFIGWKQQGTTVGLTPKQDLVQIFP